MTLDDFTPTQRRILEVLKDMQPHRRDEVRLCVDEMASLDNLKYHLIELRKRIRPHGYDIICQLLNHTLHYRVICLDSMHWSAGVV